MTRLRQLLEGLRESFWFIPAVVVLASMAAAALLIELDATDARSLAEWSPRLFGASAEGSRAMLSAIATSMITVAGVVFSITVVVLSQASAQYSPRVLRNFMRDRPTQAVLGVFVGVFAYCLVVLRTVRSADGGAFIPSLAVLGGMAYAFAAIATLIFFIHHVAQGIQAASIVQRIAEETRAAIDHLYPEKVAAPATHRAAARLPKDWAEVRAVRSGYVVSVDGGALVQAAVKHGRVVRLRPRVGDFVAEGGVLLELGGSEPPDHHQAARLRAAVLIGHQRTTTQDAAFGLQQLVDVAVKALSPGINDPTTASMCIDRLGALLARLAGRQFPDVNRVHEGELRLVLPAPDFGEFAGEVFRPLLAHCRGDVQVLEALVRALETAAGALSGPGRAETLLSLGRELRRQLGGVRPRGRARPALGRLRNVLDGLRSPMHR